MRLNIPVFVVVFLGFGLAGSGIRGIGVAEAGYAVDVILPPETMPGEGYLPGETLGVQIGVTADGENDVYARLITFDFAATSPELMPSDWDWAPAYENGQALCALAPQLCGSGHAEFITWPTVNTTFTGLAEDDQAQVMIPGSGSIVVGRLDVTLPAMPGIYELDAIHADHVFTKEGARIAFGFTSLSLVDQFDGGVAAIRVVPEPASLALWAIGLGWACRRRRAGRG